MNNIRTEQRESILLVTVDRPKALNALNRETLEELKQVIDGIDTAATRCVIVTGGGEKAFVAGADIAAMQNMTKAEAKAFSDFGNGVFRALETLPIPVIAAVNGFALGGGCELAIACDIRVCSENAVFGQPEVALGITAGFGGTQRLARLIGEGWAKQLLYTAARIKAPQALEIGLVNQIFPAGELMDAAMGIAKAIAANGPIAVSATKTALTEGLEMDTDSALALEAERFSSCFESADQREAMSAMLEKRPAKPFQGR